MARYNFEEVKKRLNEIVHDGGEPELKLLMCGKEYMIIGYKNYYSFQRCGKDDDNGEIEYNTLEELYNTETVDNILLKRDWGSIDDFELDGMDGIYL